MIHMSDISVIMMRFFFVCSALTPYYNEHVLFSIKELEEENEDGVSTLFYLQKIYPGRGEEEEQFLLSSHK